MARVQAEVDIERELLAVDVALRRESIVSGRVTSALNFSRSPSLSSVALTRVSMARWDPSSETAITRSYSRSQPSLEPSAGLMSEPDILAFASEGQPGLAFFHDEFTVELRGFLHRLELGSINVEPTQNDPGGHSEATHNIEQLQSIDLVSVEIQSSQPL